MDGYTVIASQKVQENLLQLLFVGGDFVPCGGEVRAEVFQDTWNALCQLIVGGSQVQPEVEGFRGFEVMAQRIYLVMDSRRGIQLGDVRTIHSVPRECLSLLDHVFIHPALLT